jgi:uncharacterized protein YhaN
MKILQLELIAFGFFTDKILDFSSGRLHFLYGANEAGKSTMRRALISMFFGVPERTADAYLHPNDQLRIGVRLQGDNGEELICYRRKGRKNTLLDINNKPLDEEVLQAFLGGMNETQFTAQCCFDHERLRQGGEDLLNGGGNVGESLFEAGTGSLKVHDVLVELNKEKEELFKARGTKPLLNKTIRLYKDACKRIKDFSLSANQWSDHAKKLDEVRQQHTLLTNKLQNLRAEQHRLERIQRTRPLLLRYQELKVSLSNLNQVIILPDDATSKRIQAKLALRTAQNQERQALQDIDHLQHQIEAIEIPEALLAHKATLDDLRGRLGSHQKAARDLPGVRTEMRTVESEARALLRCIYPQLDLIEVSTTITVTNPQREHIKRLASTAPALYEKQHSIVKRLEEIGEQLAQQHDALESLPFPPNLTILQAALSQACQYGNLEEIYAKDKQEIRLLTEKINIGLKQIEWSSNLEALEQAALPRTERIESFDHRFKELENDRQRIKERVLETRQRNERSTQKINALCWAGEIPTEKALAKARQQRQQHWLKVKQLKSPQLSLDKGGIDDIYQAFEKTMLYVDELADRLRREASRVAEYTMLLAEQQSAQREQEQQTKKWHTCESLLTNLQHEWEDNWKSVDIKPWSPQEMRGWLNECLNLRQQANILRENRQKLEEKQQLMTNICQELTQALTSFKSLVLNGEILTRLSDIIKQGETCVTAMTNLQRQRENLQLEINKLIKEQQRTETAQQQANDALKQWQTSWASALSPLKMHPDTPPETARNVLNDLDQVLNKIDKANGLRRRVDLMEKDATVFRRDVVTVAQAIAPELVNEAVEHVIPTLSNRLSQAEQDLTRAEQLQQRLHVEQQRKATADLQVQSSQAHLSVLLEQAHCNDLIALEEAEQASLQKKEIQRERADVEQQLLEQGEGMSLTELANAVAVVDIDQLPGQLQNCKEQIQHLEQERSSIDQNIGELRTLLKQMDGNAQAAQAADEAQLALAEIQNLSERYMQIHLAASVLRKSIENFREQNQGPLVKRASELFQRLTLNSFCGLKTDYQNDQPILVGLRTSNSAAIPITGMSEGTRDQMYLALRLASIEHYMGGKKYMPLILDDILINFDDERSQATLSVLGELCQQTQILFLTHHPRLVELAKKEVPSESLVMHRL